MATAGGLYLHEELLLLALRDEEGTIAAGSQYAYAIAGAVLAELVVRGRLAIVHERKKRFLEVRDRTPVGEQFLDESLARIVEAKRRGTLGTWLGRLAQSRKMRDRLAEGLRRRGILRADEQDVLIFFRRKTWPTVDPGPEGEVVDRLRRAIFTGADADARTIVLLSLADRTGLLGNVFDRKELKTRRKRIDTLIAQEAIGEAAKNVIDAMQVTMLLIATS